MAEQCLSVADLQEKKDCVTNKDKIVLSDQLIYLVLTKKSRCKQMNNVLVMVFLEE